MAETSPTILDAGIEAPAIEAATARGEKFDLAEQRGRWVVVYFFPRSNTPG